MPGEKATVLSIIHRRARGSRRCFMSSRMGENRQRVPRPERPPSGQEGSPRPAQGPQPPPLLPLQHLSRVCQQQFQRAHRRAGPAAAGCQHGRGPGQGRRRQRQRLPSEIRHPGQRGGVPSRGEGRQRDEGSTGHRKRPAGPGWFATVALRALCGEAAAAQVSPPPATASAAAQPPCRGPAAGPCCRCLSWPCTTCWTLAAASTRCCRPAASVMQR
jgi:hypothetical protein